MAGSSERLGAMCEPLTGLASRSLFADRTRQALARGARERWTTAVFAIDVDNFRKINEGLGYAAGDEALREVARRLEASVRPYDTVARPEGSVARLGGDEFLVMCENVPDDQGARVIASRIAAALAEPLQYGEISVGIGIALAPPEGREVEAVILDSEAALRRAKSEGPGRVVVFSEEMRSDGTDRGGGSALREALLAREFVLHYQPKVLLANDRFIGVEALVRWDSPSVGLLGPDRFIPLAEETGLIVDLGAWVFEEACRQAQGWRARFPEWPPLVVAVNVSAGQFEPAFVPMVADVLARSGMAASNVCLEVTESVVMDDIDSAIAILEQLKALGVTVSIDDFGTGYSSLAYLRRLPIDELKIDRSFVDGLGRRPEDTAIVAGVVAMAHALDLTVVAEGVETREQLERLRVLGCEQVQGYYFSRPVPADALEELLADELTRRHTEFDPHTGGYRSDIVVIADDSPEVLQVAEVSLTAAGFEVHQADNGRAAVELARELHPTCVVLDVRMPEMDGFEACRVLRADPATAGCTIVLLTSDCAARSKVEGFSAGADDYIMKPFAPRDLVGRVRAAVGRRQEQVPHSPQ